MFSPELNYDVADNLKIIARYSIDYFQDNRVDYWPSGSAGDGRNGLWGEDRISNKINNFKEDEVIESSKLIEKAFREIKFPINNNQLASAMVLAVLLKDDKRLLC